MRRKKLIAWVLAAAMSLSTASPAFAYADTNEMPPEQETMAENEENFESEELSETDAETFAEEEPDEAETAETEIVETEYYDEQSELQAQVRSGDEIGLLADFTFDGDDPLDGGPAQAEGNYSLSEYRDGQALYLNGSNSNYLSVTKTDGSSLLAGQEEITISFDARQDRTTTNWPFFAAPNTTAQSPNYEKYLGGLVSGGKLTVERYNNTGVRPDSAAAQIGNDWVHVDVVVRMNETAIFVDGILADTESSAHRLAAVAGENGIFQIGKANWGSGEFYKGWIDNFKVYDGALDEEQIEIQYQPYALEKAFAELDLGDLSAVKENLELPVELDRGIQVIWTSSNEAAIAADGTVTRSAEDQEVELTATLILGDYSIEKVFAATVLHSDVSQDLDDASEALKMVAVTAEDINLPVNGILGTTITWVSSDSTLMSDEGEVKRRPAVGAGNDTVRMTATIAKDGQSVDKEFEIEIMEEFYGYILGYITGDNDRTGSLHIAHSTDGRNFTALNGNSGIHFARINTNDGTKNLSTGIRFSEVSLFRKADGSFGLAAPQGKDRKAVYLYDSADLLTYQDERLLATNTSIGNVSGVSCSYDTLIGAYRLNWQNGDKKYSNISDDLTALKRAAEYDFETPAMELESIPEGAKNYSVIAVTKAEYEKVTKRFDVVENTGVSSPAAITIEKGEDIEEALPKNVVASYSDGSESSLNVSWDIDSVDLSAAGTYTIPGTVSTYSNPLVEQRADPQIMYDQDRDCYYFTGSYPAYNNVNQGYDRIILRKADSIQELSDDNGGKDKEITIWRAPATGQMAKHVWAPELHQIGGKWYVFFAAGNSNNVWGIRPYILVCQGDDPYNADNWVDENGNPEIHAATSIEADYFKNMSLDMTYFEHNGRHYVIWADIIGQSALYMQEIDPAAPWAGTSSVTLLTTPEFGWERDTERVNEGATIIKHGGKIFCAFAASGTGPEYCIGILYADENADLLDPDSWTKMSYPLLTSADVPGEYGPGHNSFTVDASGNPVFVYHARSQECYENKCQWASADSLYDPCRHARVKNVHWNEEGLPILKMNAEQECPPAIRSTSIQVTVQQDTDRNLARAKVVLPEELEATGAQLKPTITVSYQGTPLEENTHYTVSYGENTAVGEGSVTITAVPDSGCIGSKTVTFAIVEPAGQIVHYDMSHQDGKITNQAEAGGLDGTMNDIEEKDFNSYNGVSTLDLKKKGYISLPAGIIDDGTLTVSVTAATSLFNNQWLWTFGKNSWNYTFFTPSNGDKRTKFSVAQQEPNNNTGAYQQENSIMVGSDALDGRYQNYTVVINNDKTELYINGTRVGTGVNPFDLTSIVPGSGTSGYIGKSLYSADPLFTGKIADFKVYSNALSANQIKAISDSVDYRGYITADIYSTMMKDNERADEITGSLSLPAKLDGVDLNWEVPADQEVIGTDGKVNRPTDGQDAAVTLKVTYQWNDEAITEEFPLTVKAADDDYIEELADKLILPYSKESGKEVYGNITLPKTVGDAEVSWTTSHPAIIDVNEHANEGVYADDPVPAGTVTRPAEDTEVTMTAAITYGEMETTRTYTFTVKAAPQQLEENDYTDYFFAYFTGEYFSDGEQVYFSASRDGLNWSDLNDTKPYLTSTLGEKGVRDPFILRSPEGDKFYMIATDLKIYGNNDWGAAQTAGSQSLMVWESTDLVNWSDQRMVTVSAEIDAGCTWAPEATYDETTGEYVVYWASKVAGKNYDKQRLYYAKTRDFYTFTEPQLFIEKPDSAIDTTILKEGDYYYRYTKNEDTKGIIADKTPTLLHSDATTISSPVLEAQGGVEGPSIFKFNQDDVAQIGYQYCLLLDKYGQGGYYPMVSNDLEGDFTVYTGTYNLPGGSRPPRHGTPIRITEAEYRKVMDAMADKAALTELKIDGTALDTFEPGQRSYVIPVTGKDLPVITAAGVAGAEVDIKQATETDLTAAITVTEDGLGQGVYQITFVREITDLKLEGIPASLEAGQSAAAKVTAVTSAGSQDVSGVTYSSDNTGVLAVSGNKLQAKKAGKANVKAALPSHTFVNETLLEKYNAPAMLYENKGNAADFIGVSGSAGGLQVPNGTLSFYDIDGAASEWDQYAVSGSFNITAGAAGIVFGAEDSSNFYMWQFKNGSLNMHKWIDGTAKVVATANISLKNGANEFKIYKEKNVIYTYLNGSLAASYIDTTPFGAGTIGLRTGSSEAFTVTGLKVEQTRLVLTKAVTVTAKPDETEGPKETETPSTEEPKPITVSKVQSVKLSPKITSVKLTWKKISDADGYEVYRYNDKTKKYSRIKTVSGTTYTDKKRSPAAAQRYKVRAYRKVKGQTYYGSYSNEAKVLTLPRAPRSVKIKRTSAVGRKTTASLSFKKSSGASAYYIYRYDKKKKKYIQTYRIKGKILYSYNTRTGKYKRLRRVTDKKGTITCRLVGLNLKKDKSQRYLIKAGVSRKGYRTRLSANSKRVVLK